MQDCTHPSVTGFRIGNREYRCCSHCERLWEQLGEWRVDVVLIDPSVLADVMDDLATVRQDIADLIHRAEG